MSLVANTRFATLLAIALALLLSGVAAGAAGGYLIIGAANQAGVSNTSLDTTSSGFAWQMYQHGTGVGVFGISDNGVALAGLANNGNQYALSVTNAGAAGTGAAIIADGRANTAADFRVNSNSIPPLKVNSTGRVTNLNADLLDGLDSTGLVRAALMQTDAQTALGTEEATYGTALSITAPSAGFVVVNSNVSIWNNGCTSGACQPVGQIRHITGSAYSQPSRTDTTGGAFISFGNSHVFAVNAGVNTFDLRLSRVTGGNGTLTAFWGELTALFVPFGSTGGGTL